MKKIKYIIFILFILISFTGCMRNNNKARITIIATNFPSYDFTRALIKDVDDVEVKLLVKPGSETHDFEPTPQDIIDIKNSDIFIYVGGDSDSWIKDIISDLDLDKKKLEQILV